MVCNVENIAVQSTVHSVPHRVVGYDSCVVVRNVVTQQCGKHCGAECGTQCATSCSRL